MLIGLQPLSTPKKSCFKPLQLIHFSDFKTLLIYELLTHIFIGLQPDLMLKNDKKLQEMHFGQWEGKAWADIPEAELTAWTDEFATYPAGGTGESVTQFMARVAEAFDELDPQKDTLWVTHAGVIRAATLIAKGIRHIERADQWPAEAPSYGQWCKLSF